MSPDGQIKLENMLKRQEGLRLKPYKDSQGKLTIGYGRNIESVGISEAEADALLSNDIKNVLEGLNLVLPWAWNLNEPRQIALASMAFNLGLRGLLQFHATLSALELGKWQIAHDQVINSRAAQQDKTRYLEIAEIFLTGNL